MSMTFFFALVVPHLMQLPAKVSEKVEEDGPNTWTPATLLGGPDEVLGSWLWPGPGLDIVGIWGLSQ